MTPAGRESGGITSTGAFSSESVSPVVVSFNLATATISPAIAVASGVCFLPSSLSSWPKRSFDSRVELSTAPSLFARPEMTRKIESLPGNGILAFDRRALIGRREKRRDRIEQRRDADIFCARSTEDRRDSPVDHSG